MNAIEEDLQLQEVKQLEEKIDSLEKENQKLTLKIKSLQKQIEYNKNLYEANFSDHFWRSTKQKYPTIIDKEIVYNVGGNYRIGFFDTDKKVFRNKYNGMEIDFIKVSSWCYLDSTLKECENTPKRVKQAIIEYRDKRKEQREIYQNKQDDNDDIEIDCDSGFAYDGYCPCGNSMDLYITGDGDVWMNDYEVVFNIFNWVHVYKNGQEVER